jgi:hypothetical protein
MAQKNYKPHYEHLKNKWTDRQKDLQRGIWDKHRESLEWLIKYMPSRQHLAAGALGGLLLFASPQQVHAVSLFQPFDQVAPAQDIDKNVFLISDLSKVLPPDVQPLTPEQETTVGSILSQKFGIPVSASLNGYRLNRSYGLIGQEQHLARFPGDGMGIHFSTDADAGQFGKYGMAPGLGGWGYFAQSQATMTPEENLREKYYIAVQSFLAPGWDSNSREMYQFFKFRKMLVVNPQNGKAVVADIGDAGPAPWTGKHLGGSPEVMHYLDRVDGAARGPVLYFFINDPNDQVPLGPIEVQ